MGLFSKEKFVREGDLNFVIRKNAKKEKVATLINMANAEVITIPETIKNNIPVVAIEEGLFKDRSELKVLRINSKISPFPFNDLTNSRKLERIEFPNGSNNYDTFEEGKIVVYTDRYISYTVFVVPTYNKSTLQIYKGAGFANSIIDLHALGVKKVFVSYSCFNTSSFVEKYPDIDLEFDNNISTYETKDGVTYYVVGSTTKSVHYIARNATYILEHKNPSITFEDVKRLQVLRFKKLIIPDTVTEIAKGTFEKFHFQELEIQGNTILHDQSFNECPELKKVTIYKGVKFNDTWGNPFTKLPSLEKIEVTGDVGSFSNDKNGVLYWKKPANGKTYLFKFPAASKLEKYKVSEGTSMIWDNAFEGTKLKEVEFPKTTVKFGPSCFEGSALENLIVTTDEACEIYWNSFSNIVAGLKKVSVPAQLSIYENAFLGTKIDEVEYRGYHQWLKDGTVSISKGNDTFTLKAKGRAMTPEIQAYLKNKK